MAQTQQVLESRFNCSMPVHLTQTRSFFRLVLTTQVPLDRSTAVHIAVSIHMTGLYSTAAPPNAAAGAPSPFLHQCLIHIAADAATRNSRQSRRVGRRKLTGRQSATVSSGRFLHRRYTFYRALYRLSVFSTTDCGFSTKVGFVQLTVRLRRY